MKHILPPLQALLIVLTLLAPVLGLACWMGKPTEDYIPEDREGLWERGEVWKYRKSFGRVRFYVGYTAYAMLDGTFRAAPILTIKL